MNELDILEIRRRNYSFEYINKNRVKNNSEINMELSIKIENKFKDYQKENIVKSLVNIDISFKNIEQNNYFAKYNDQYILIQKFNEDLEELNEKQEKEFNETILSVVEPYLRMYLERTLFENEIPRAILPYRFWRGIEGSIINEN